MNGRRIAVTGACGFLGAKLASHLREQGAELVLIDREPAGRLDVMRADLSVWSPEWVACLAGVEAVLHLAADPKPDAAWDRLEPDNVDATLNILQAAAAQGVRRVILASSVHAVLGKVGREARIDEGGPGDPVNFYGVTKCVGERLGAHYARHFGLSVIALRIGWVLWGDSPPGPSMGHLENHWLWLSDGDLCRGVIRAIEAPGIDFGVFTLVSDVEGMPWDLGAGARALGWRPLDRYSPEVAAPAVPPPPQPPLPGLVRRLRRRVCGFICR